MAPPDGADPTGEAASSLERPGKMKTRLSIQTAADLFNALRSPSQAVRLAVLRGVAADPQRALQLGRFHDWDVIDELVHHANQSCSVPYYRALMEALAVYDDPRVDLLFRKVSFIARDEEILATVRRRLSASTEVTGEAKP